MTAETGWLPDLLYRNGRFESGVAMFAGADGRITRFSSDPAELASARRLTRRVLLPGLVNVHSHSFQRAIRGRTESRTSSSGDSFWTWREAMYHAAGLLSPTDIYDVARMTFLEAAASGNTAIGEFHYLHHAADGTRYEDPNEIALAVIRAAREIGMRIELQRTAYVRSGWNREPNPRQARFITRRVEDFIANTESLRAAASRDPEGAVTVGIAPHSVRAVPLDYLTAIVGYARSSGIKIHMHVSEQPAELDACVAEYGLPPVEFLDRHGLLDADFTGVHATHISNGEAAALARAGSFICACPTTERNLGDGIGDAALWASCGIPVCLGSDSNVQIDLLEDARELEYHMRLQRLERAVLAPDLDTGSLARQLFRSATSAGAASIGTPSGRLDEGLAADFFTIHLDDLAVAGADPASLLSHIVFSASRASIRDVAVNGQLILEDGHHRLEEEVIRRFAAVQRKLWGAAV